MAPADVREVKMFLLAMTGSFLVSCQDGGDSPEEVLFQEKQEELEALQEKLKITQLKADEMKVAPPERSLEELKREFEEKEGVFEELGEELGLQRKSEREAREQLEEFQKKYPEWGNSAPRGESGGN